MIRQKGEKLLPFKNRQPVFVGSNQDVAFTVRQDFSDFVSSQPIFLVESQKIGADAGNASSPGSHPNGSINILADATDEIIGQAVAVIKNGYIPGFMVLPIQTPIVCTVPNVRILILEHVGYLEIV